MLTIELAGVGKSYCSKRSKIPVHALKDVCAKFEGSGVVAIVGPDGAGKTTLLNCMCGLDRFTSGDVLINGDSAIKYDERAWDSFRAQCVSFLFKDFNLVDSLNIVDNVAMGLAFNGTPRFVARKHAKEALSQVGFDGKMSAVPADLTPVQKQLACIARAIVKNPDVILADEPTGSLDSASGARVMEALQTAGKECLVIVATHDGNLADKYATRRFDLFDGQMASAPAKSFAPVDAAFAAVAPTASAEPAPSSATASPTPTMPAPAVTVVAGGASAMAAASATPTAPAASAAPATSRTQPFKTKIKQSGMGFSFIRTLSYQSFGDHKARSGFSILASSIGTVALSLILALSVGLNGYINYIQETVYGHYPITVSKYKGASTDTATSSDSNSSTDTSSTDASNEKETKRAQYLSDAISNHRVALNNTIASLLSSNGQTTTDNSATLLNDVASLKAYLDTNPDDVMSSIASIDYTYATCPVIYSTANGNNLEVFPGSLFGSLGSGSSGSRSLTASLSSSSSLLSIMSDFRQLPGNASVYNDADSLVEGRYPTNSSEALLVLNTDGTIDDTLAYTLGFKDFTSEIQPLIDKYRNGEKVDYPGIYDSYAYSDVTGITFKVINPADVYQKRTDGTWEDKSSDTDFMNNLVANGQDLTIVGVVKPVSGSKADAALSTGIYYYPTLTNECIDRAASSQIVQEQLANPDVDVFTGKTFAWLKHAGTICERFDFSNIINVDVDLLASCVTLHPEVLEFSEEDFEEGKEEVVEEVQLSDEEIAKMLVNLLEDPDFQEFIADLASSPTFDRDLESALAGAGTAYAEYCAEKIADGETPQAAEVYFSEEGDGYAYTVIAQTLLPASMEEDIANFVAKYATRVSDYLIQTLETELNALLVDVQDQLVKELGDIEAWLNDESEDDGPGLIEFDESKFADAIKINITEEDVSQLGYYLCGFTSNTYVGNLSDLGYATYDAPVSCAIYSNSFADKQKISDVLDKYNDQRRAEGDQTKVISYTNLVGTIGSIAQSVVTAIGAVLALFVVIALLYVFILIAIVCGISTLQRAREAGILRALGACRKDIFVLFDTQTLLLGFISGVAGCAIAALVGLIVNASVANAGVTYDIVQLTPQIVIGVILGYTVVATIAGILPSLIASRKDPVRAIK